MNAIAKHIRCGRPACQCWQCNAAGEIERLEAENKRLREALSYIAMHGGTLPNDNEMHVSCNGLWCAKQAKAALGKEGQ